MHCKSIERGGRRLKPRFAFLTGWVATVASNGVVNERCWKRHGHWRSESAKDGYVVDSVDKRVCQSDIGFMKRIIATIFIFFETLLDEFVLNV